jgi:uncharacterized protein (TIGR03083 family)
VSDELTALVSAWRESVDRVLALAGDLRSEALGRPTDLPGWSVQDVLAHLAAIECDLAGLPGASSGPTSPPRVEGPARVTDPFTAYTEAGVQARRGRPIGELLEELRTAVEARTAQLRQAPPTDPTGAPPRTPGGIGWDWRTLLRNRAVDVWMHEQDVRRAVGRPGGLDSAGAAVTLGSFAAAIPYVVGKRVAPPAGTIVGLAVDGPVPISGAVRVGADGRAALLPGPTVPADADAVLRMSGETFAILCGGRRPPEAVDIEVRGDAELARRVAGAMAVTP